jgi:hypothetical protein
MAGRENIRVFNPHTGQYESGGDAVKNHFSPDPEAEHMAQVDGKSAPGDRTEEELRGLDPADAGPVVTGNITMSTSEVQPVVVGVQGGREAAPGQAGEIKRAAGKDK